MLKTGEKEAFWDLKRPSPVSLHDTMLVTPKYAEDAWEDVESSPQREDGKTKNRKGTIIRQDKGAQTQTFGSGCLPVGWGSSA